jgi:hypothetical protein
MPDIFSNSGNFLTYDEAKGYLQEFLDDMAPTVGGDVKTAIVSGQTIGLSFLTEFLDNIHQYNADPAHADNPIAAVRIYYARSNRKDQYPKKLRDVILEPVLANGDDLHHLFPEKGRLEDRLILGEAMPCPNLCTGGAFNLL